MDLVSRNPATGALIAEYRFMDPAELDRLLTEIAAAQQQWKRQSLAERCAALVRFAEVLTAHRDEAAHMAALEMGKPITQGRAEVDKCAWACRVVAQQASEGLSPIPVETEFHTSRIQFEPLGVVLGIMPWNFPFWQVVRAAAPALVAGNAMVIKHSPEVTGCAVLIDQFAEKAGLAAVLRTIRASHAQVAELIGDRRIAAVTLTGSTRAGRIVAARAGEALKKTVLELGGSDPYIMLEDADLESAVETCVAARMINSGQSCIAAKRFIVAEPIRAAFEEMFVERMRRYEPGDPLDSATVLGPLARRDLAETLVEQARQSIRLGARVLLEGGGPVGSGAFVRPMVLTDVAPGMPAFDEETFGPLAAIIPARDEQDALALANRSAYGLGAAVFTRDQERGQRIAHELEAGSVFINAFVRSDPRLPFGGIKDSGWGRELSMFGMREFVNIKTVVVA
jgi:succinate-semialdehyde dehydrogenase/glutarate-semialdehyde dehydrogenase